MTIQSLTTEKMILRVIDIIDRETYLTKGTDGRYEGEIYADYRDELEQHTIKKLFKSDNPREAFYDLMFESYVDCEWDYKSEIIDIVKKHFDDDDEEIYYAYHEDAIRDWIDENVYFNYPYKHYLNQDVCVDIIIDAGDGNYEFTMNELFGCNYSEKGYKEDSSLIWLMKQQGYTEKRIKKFIKSVDFKNSKLLESIYHECINTTSCCNALTFFVSMTIEE
jgi:hypothetical protein